MPADESPDERTTVRENAGRAELKNYPAYVGLCCGIASLVPWVFVLMFPLAVVFCAVGLLRAARLPDREGRAAAVIGLGVGVTAAVLQFALVGLGAIIGLVGC